MPGSTGMSSFRCGATLKACCASSAEWSERSRARVLSAVAFFTRAWGAGRVQRIIFHALARQHHLSEYLIGKSGNRFFATIVCAHDAGDCEVVGVRAAENG